MPYTRTNGITMYYEVWGQGPPVLLVGGLGSDGHFWHKQAPALARRFQVIAPDNRGAGRTDAPDEPYSMRMMADDLAGLLDGLRSPAVHVVGASMGGFIAQEFALAYPERVRKLVLCCTSFGGPNSIPIPVNALPPRTGDPRLDLKASFEMQLEPEYLHTHARELEEYIEWRVRYPQPLHGYHRQVAALVAHDAEARLGQLPMPVLILHGGRDTVIPAGNTELMAARIPGATVRIFPNAGHLFLWECADDANQVLGEFLRVQSQDVHHREG